MDTKLKIAKRFILGLNLEIHRTVEAIDPTTYKTALRSAKAMEKPRDSDMNSTPDPLYVPEEPITRIKVKKFQETYTVHLQKLASVQVETKTFEPKNLYSISISNKEDNGLADIGK